MIIKENKYLYLDRPKKVCLKQFVKEMIGVFCRLYYKFLFIVLKPPKKTNYKYEVSICSIFKDEADYLKEWIEFHILIGVEHFYLYNNNSSDNFLDILNPYIEKGLVTLKNWPRPQSQMAAYEDFFESYSSETLWVGFIDIDEFVVPNKYDSINDFLKKFYNRPSVVIYWKYFGSSGLINRDKSRLVIEDFVVCWKKYENIGKFFFNTRYNYSPSYKYNGYMHWTWAMSHKIHLPPVNIFDRVIAFDCNSVPHDDFPIQINHYVVKSFTEYLEKKSKRGGGVHKVGFHNLDYFYYHEKRCDSVDYHIFKYIIKLKENLDN